MSAEEQYIAEAQLDRLRQRLAEARILILAAPIFMPTWPENEGRNSWVRDSQKWLNSNQ